MVTNFLSLPDIVFLEVFTYLSCEDILYAFVNLHHSHLIDLLTEHGTFRQICLSSQLSRHQYTVLSNGIWRYDLVRSFVCQEIFSDFLSILTPSQIFPSLIDLRVLCLRVHEGIANFVIAHSSTLTHLSVKPSPQTYIREHYQLFLHGVLPHLNRLKLLDTNWTSNISIEWRQIGNCLQSLEYLSTNVETLSDVYLLAVNGFLPQLKSLHIYVQKAVIKSMSPELRSISNLLMPNLETLCLHINKRVGTNQGEEEVNWITIETLISHSIMPRLRRYSFAYTLLTNDEIQYIFQSSLFQDDRRRIRIRFGLYRLMNTFIDLSDITNMYNIHSLDYNKTLVKYNFENKLEFQFTWFTTTWSRWMIFWMNNNDVAPRHGVRKLGIKGRNILLDSVAKLFPNADELIFERPASLSMNDSSLTSTPLMNIRHLVVYYVIPGLELLLDGIMLPHLEYLRGLVVPIFIAFVRRANPMKTLDTINHLVIIDQLNNDENAFSFKQWHIILDVLPCLRTLLVQFNNTKCPPMELAKLFIDYIKRTIRSPLTLFSCCINDDDDPEGKEQFVNWIVDTIEKECFDVQILSIGPTRYDIWM